MSDIAQQINQRMGQCYVATVSAEKQIDQTRTLMRATWSTEDTADADDELNALYGALYEAQAQVLIAWNALDKVTGKASK